VSQRPGTWGAPGTTRAALGLTAGFIFAMNSDGIAVALGVFHVQVEPYTVTP
jgi:hypothetical protein